jgi:hypothetical protein
VGQVDVDNYLRGFYGRDPIVNNPKMIVFYTVVAWLGDPVITLLWLPPLLLAFLLYLIFLAYRKENSEAIAFSKSLIFLFFTFNIWFFFGVGIYRQLLAMVLLFIGYALQRHHRLLGMVFYVLALVVHINLLPIFLIVYCSQVVYEKRFRELLSLGVVSFLAVIVTHTTDGIVFFISSPQPSFYLLFMALTNPFLWYYGLHDLKWTQKHILLILLLITMPFSDQGRGMIFLHLALIDVAYDCYQERKEKRITKVLLLFLGYLWFQNLIIFLLKSMIIDSYSRGLDLSILVRSIGFGSIIFFKN